jgi:hypothetical protein
MVLAIGASNQKHAVATMALLVQIVGLNVPLPPLTWANQQFVPGTDDAGTRLLDCAFAMRATLETAATRLDVLQVLPILLVPTCACTTTIRRRASKGRLLLVVPSLQTGFVQDNSPTPLTFLANANALTGGGVMSAATLVPA